MYATKNFKTKKEFKLAVAAWVAWNEQRKLAMTMGAVVFHDKEPRAVTYFQPGPFGGNEPRDGVLYFEGPHFPASHKWYASAIAKDGIVVKVK